MPNSVGRRLSIRDRVAIVAVIVLALIITIPGSHFLTLWLSERGAIVLSHTVGVVLLAIAFVHWRSRRNPPSMSGGAAA
jgi:hypothetical protein